MWQMVSYLKITIQDIYEKAQVNVNMVLSTPVDMKASNASSGKKD